MREIKFKYILKNPDGLIMISDSYTLEQIEDRHSDQVYDDIEGGCDGNSSCQVNGFCECSPEFEDFVISDRIQYIGSNDINGVEIYEDDIITQDLYRDLSKKDVVYFVVIFINDGFKMRDEKGNIIEIGNYSKVVSNVYENPELLKGENNAT